MSSMRLDTPVSDVKAALRPKQVAAYCGIGVSTIWWLLKHDPKFPRPIKLGMKTTVFMRAELDAWLTQKARESRGA